MSDYYDEEEDDLIELGALLDYDLAGDDDDDDDDDDLGFSWKKRFSRSRRPSRRGSSKRRSSTRRPSRTRVKAAKARAYMNAILPTVPGVPSVGARTFPLGLGSHTFVNGAATTKKFTVSPQKPFKGQRLVAVVNRSAAAVAELLTITEFNVGTNNQLVSSGDLPLEGFVPNAFDVEMALDPATPGIDITVDISISAAPAVGETVSVALMLIGSTIN